MAIYDNKSLINSWLHYQLPESFFYCNINYNHQQQPKILDRFSEVHITSSFLLLIPWIFFFSFPICYLCCICMTVCWVCSDWQSLYLAVSQDWDCSADTVRFFCDTGYLPPLVQCFHTQLIGFSLMQYPLRGPFGRQIIHNFLPSLGLSNPPMTANVPIHVLIVTPYEMRCLNPCTIFDAI